MNESAENNERITKVESRLAYQEDMIGKLNQVIIDQQKEIDLLAGTVKSLSTKLQDIFDEVRQDYPNRKPPHY